MFPYEWFDNILKLNETELPPKAAFYSSLTGKGISDEDYDYAKKVWKTFGMKTMRDYHDFYCMVDTLQLADIMEYQRNRLMKTHGLDIAHSYTLSGFSWKAALKYTRQELELISDREMYDFIEKGAKRGGISTITHRHAKANNPYMKSDRLRGESLMSILKPYWTVERIYEKYSERNAEDMTKHLKKRLGKKWNARNDNLKNLETRMANENYILTIDEAVKLVTFADKRYEKKKKGMDEIKKRIENEKQYSIDDVCEIASDFFQGFNAKEIKALKESMERGETFNPEQKRKFLVYLDANNLYGWAMSQPLPTGKFEWMTEKELNLPFEKMPPCFIKIDLRYPKKLHDKFKELVPAPDYIIPEKSKVKKLAPNLYAKNGYVCHIKNLILYKQLGVKITKIQEGLCFEEKAWLKPYIDLNTDLRAKSTNDADKDMYKLLNNTVFGKTCENLLNRTEYRLVNSRDEALKLIGKPNFKDYTEYSESLAGIHLDPYSITLDKPSYVGIAILELSKF